MANDSGVAPTPSSIPSHASAPGFIKPTHVIYFILIVIGVWLMTVSILDCIVVHYGNTATYGKVARWLLIGTSLTAVAGGLHIWRIYRQFYLFEEENDGAEFRGWLKSPFELILRYSLFIALVCALSKANAVFELMASIPRWGGFVGLEPTALGQWLTEFAHERLRPEHQPVNYTIGCATMFTFLVVWSVFALPKVQKAKRSTVLVWIITDAIGATFWIFCAIAVSTKPTDIEGNGGVGLATCLFGAGYTLMVLIRLFLGTPLGANLASKVADLIGAESPTRFAL